MVNAQDAVLALKELNCPRHGSNLGQDGVEQRKHWEEVDAIINGFHEYLRKNYGKSLSDELHEAIITNAMSYTSDMLADYEAAEIYYREMALIADAEYSSHLRLTDAH